MLYMFSKRLYVSYVANVFIFSTKFVFCLKVIGNMLLKKLPLKRRSKTAGGPHLRHGHTATVIPQVLGAWTAETRVRRYDSYWEKKRSGDS